MIVVALQLRGLLGSEINDEIMKVPPNCGASTSNLLGDRPSPGQPTTIPDVTLVCYS